MIMYTRIFWTQIITSNPTSVMVKQWVPAMKEMFEYWKRQSLDHLENCFRHLSHGYINRYRPEMIAGNVLKWYIGI